MKICIGADGNNMDSQVAKRFGHAEYYIIYNYADGTLETIKNETGEKDDHNMLFQLIKDGINTCIVGNIGPTAFEILNSGKIKIYLARKMSALQAVESFNKSKLEELTEPTVKKSIGHGTENHRCTC